jgi:hypothetical protein
MSSIAPVRPVDAAVVPGVRGWPWWAVVLLAAATTLLGAALDGLTIDALGWGLRVGFVVGVALAALLVRRASLFTAMVQPPLIAVLGVVVGGMLFTSVSGLYGTALRVIATFPTMAVGTAAAVLIGVIRIVAQPLRPASDRRPVPVT